jgi:hypothetical protein
MAPLWLLLLFELPVLPPVEFELPVLPLVGLALPVLPLVEFEPVEPEEPEEPPVVVKAGTFIPTDWQALEYSIIDGRMCSDQSLMIPKIFLPSDLRLYSL